MKSKDKGKRGELEVAKLLRSLGFPEARRTAQYCGNTGDAADVTGIDGIHIEVKRSEGIRMMDWIKQAERDCRDKLPVVVWRQSNQPWRVSLRADVFFQWYRELMEYRNDTAGQRESDKGTPEAVSERQEAHQGTE